VPNHYFVSLTVYLADGTSFDRTTGFTYEQGRGWVHSLTGEEYDMFDSKLPASATPTATAEQSSVPTAGPSCAGPPKPETAGQLAVARISEPGADWRAAMLAGAYYASLEVGSYDYAYQHYLSSVDKARYTLDQWNYAMDAIGADQSTYEVVHARPGRHSVIVSVEITVPSGEVVPKEHIFVQEDCGLWGWRHKLNAEEIELLDGALASR
jgi:hypothetical protein